MAFEPTHPPPLRQKGEYSPCHYARPLTIALTADRKGHTAPKGSMGTTLARLIDVLVLTDPQPKRALVADLQKKHQQLTLDSDGCLS